MGVGSLENVCIVPCGVGIVGPALDGAAAAAHAAAGGIASDEAVAHCGSLSAGKRIVGVCVSVCVALEYTELCKDINVALSPVAVGILKLVVADIRDGEQASDHCGELGTGDICVGMEVAVGEALDQARLIKGADLSVVPCACTYILKGAGGDGRE